MRGPRVKTRTTSRLKQACSKTIACHGRVDLLRIDEPGYKELNWHGAEPLPSRFLTVGKEKYNAAIVSSESSGTTHVFRRTRARRCLNMRFQPG
ncbi:hypothetical protein SAMN05216252_11654 [Actinacidiphila glaucinigra]|uniref:Uncharacterized protein n=1 Tax=Actinacidiphila glaucinigra TaxID=235986 RepID=A0A239KLN5_9ACTN|nr:hypothetical protein SAMN05216252_11654 [Actinacidiphila glaucinigra]